MEKSHPQDPLGSASEAASYLFEECYRQGVLTSEFFLEDKLFLGKVPRKPDPELRAAFFAADKQAQDLAQLRLKVRKFRGKETVFVQGDPARNIMYVQEGGVKLTVVSATGKEAVVAILGPGDFFGEGCLAGLPFASRRRLRSRRLPCSSLRKR